MKEIRTCLHDMDNLTIGVTFTDGSRMVLDRKQIEDQLDITMIGESRLRWLIDNEITTYVELYLTGELEDYCKSYEREYHLQAASLYKKLSKRYDEPYARAIAREIMMYDT